MRVWTFFRPLVRSVALTLGTLIVLMLIAGAILAISTGGAPDVEDDSWLVLKLTGEYTEYAPPGSAVSRLMGEKSLTHQDVLDNLGKAAEDERIEGVILQLSSDLGIGWAKLQELREAVAGVRAADKPVYAWGDRMDLKTLYLASATESIMMPAAGDLLFTGMSTRSLHVRGLLEKLGIEPHISKIKDYKSAAELITETQMTEPAREMRAWLLEENWDIVLGALAEERGIDKAKLRTRMEYADYQPAEALEAGLIDEVIYWQELEARLKDEDDDELKTVSHQTYRKVPWTEFGRDKKASVAVVHAQGMIGGRSNRVDPLLGIMMGHESVVAALRKARLDEDIKAVVFRVDSGGGDALASDLIAKEVETLAATKPVVVSMVDVAASGGYYIAYKADHVLAAPLTVTGSIGSISGMFNLRAFYDTVGISKDFVSKGPMARYFSDYEAPSEAQWQRFTDAHWRDFDNWMMDVAERRDLSREEIESLAHGRVWSGRQAQENGLIDSTGFLDDAIRRAAELAELEDLDTLAVRHLPEEQGMLAMLRGGGSNGALTLAQMLSSTMYLQMHEEIRDTTRFLTEGVKYMEWE